METSYMILFSVIIIAALVKLGYYLANRFGNLPYSNENHEENKIYNTLRKIEKDYQDTLVKNFNDLDVRLLKSGTIVKGDQIYPNDPTVENISKSIYKMYFNIYPDSVSDLGKYLYKRFIEMPSFQVENIDSGMGANFVTSKDGSEFLARLIGSDYRFTRFGGYNSKKYCVEPGMEGYLVFLESCILEYNVSKTASDKSNPKSTNRDSTSMKLKDLVSDKLKMSPDLSEDQINDILYTELKTTVSEVMSESK